MGIDYASTDAPFGFTPYGEAKCVNVYALVTSYGTAVFIGDAMEIGGTAITTKLFGTIQNAQVEEGGAVGSILGAVVGLLDSDGMPTNTIAATTVGDGTVAGYAMIADDPLQKYLVQEDGDTSSIQVADVGLNAEGVSTHSGDTTTGVSKMELDSDSVNTTSTLAWKILGVHPDDTISAAGAAGTNCRFIVMPNSSHAASNIDGA